MIAFLRRIWVFVKPYQSRLMLGLLCGILYAAANGAVVMAVKVVINLVFATPGSVSVFDELQKAPKALRPLLDQLMPMLPELKSPSSKLGMVLVITTVPLIFLVRGVLSYLNIYLMSWAAIRA